MGYIVQCNKCGLRFEGSEDIASERIENRNFRRILVHCYRAMLCVARLSYRNSVRLSLSISLSHSWTVSTWFDLRS